MSVFAVTGGTGSNWSYRHAGVDQDILVPPAVASFALRGRWDPETDWQLAGAHWCQGVVWRRQQHCSGIKPFRTSNSHWGEYHQRLFAGFFGSKMRWLNSNQQLADGLTKRQAREQFAYLLRRGIHRVVYDGVFIEWEREPKSWDGGTCQGHVRWPGFCRWGREQGWEKVQVSGLQWSMRATRKTSFAQGGITTWTCIVVLDEVILGKNRWWERRQ